MRWPGGLENELSKILPYMPKEIENFYDPFLGSGDVFFSTEADGYYLNEPCPELIEIYKAAKKGRGSMWHTLESACHAWKSVEARIIGVQDELLQLAFDYPRKWHRRYAEFCLEVKDVLKNIWFSDLFTFMIPDPADFCVELRHQVIDALIRISEEDMDGEDAVEEILTGMKAAVFYFMSEVYYNPAVDNGVRSAALIFTSHYSKVPGFCWDYPELDEEDRRKMEESGVFLVPENRPEYMGVDFNRLYLDGILAMREDEAFKEKMSHTHFWNVKPSHFLQKNKIGYGDFLFMAPQTERDFTAAIQYIKSARCNTRWMLIISEFPGMEQLLEMRGVSAMGLLPEGKLTMFKNY